MTMACLSGKSHGKNVNSYNSRYLSLHCGLLWLLTNDIRWTNTVSANPTAELNLAVISFPACSLVQHLAISQFVTSVDSWVLLKPRPAHLWADMLVLAVRGGDPSRRILIICSFQSLKSSLLNPMKFQRIVFSSHAIQNIYCLHIGNDFILTNLFVYFHIDIILNLIYFLTFLDHELFFTFKPIWHNNKQKNPAYGRQRISRPMRIVGPIQFW